MWRTSLRKTEHLSAGKAFVWRASMEKDINMRGCMCMFQRRAALNYSVGSIQSVTPVLPTVWRELLVDVHVQKKEEESVPKKNQNKRVRPSGSETEQQHKEQRSIVQLRVSSGPLWAARPHAHHAQPAEKSWTALAFALCTDSHSAMGLLSVFVWPGQVQHTPTAAKKCHTNSMESSLYFFVCFWHIYKSGRIIEENLTLKKTRKQTLCLKIYYFKKKTFESIMTNNIGFIEL